MGELLIDLLLPDNDRMVAIQLVVVLVLGPLWIWQVRDRPDMRLLAIGVTVATLAWFGLRTLH